MNTKPAQAITTLSMGEANFINRVMTNLNKLAEPPAKDGTLSDTSMLITLASSMLHHPAETSSLRSLRTNCLLLASSRQQELDILEATSLAIMAMEGQPDGFANFLRFVNEKGFAPPVSTAKME